MLLRRLARPLLAGIFISGGVAALRDLEGHAKAASPVLDQVAGYVPVPEAPSNVTLVQIDASVKIGAGLLLATGKAPRLAAAALAGSLIPTTLAGHRFWEMEDPEQRADHQVHFMKNLALLGGLMLASADTAGKPSLAWRARKAGRTSAATAELFHRDITEGVGELSKRAGVIGGQAAEVAGRYGEQAGDVVGRTGERVVDLAGRYGPQAAETAGLFAGRAGEVAGRATERAGEVAGRASERAADLAGRYGPQASELAERAGERLAERTERFRAEAEKLSRRAAKRADKAAKRAQEAGKHAQKVGKKARKRAAKQADRARASIPSW